ncbi:MAG: flavodoxin-dependent (E)-4-hydroxy-3-methylbut-2-enyl-diphosphate synthase [Bacillota bacterium]|nr:flavodoxin-dependent (E)-4-hydroxy-3-methylbut-2-enyl-diphosphate synthase [Bacillota bacterium]
MKRRKTYLVKIGSVQIGGSAPVMIQSMTNTKTSDAAATLKQIAHLQEAGCEVVRVAVPDPESAEALKYITKESPLPVIADIHFDVKLAHMAIERGAAKIRINPGNIGSPDTLIELAQKAKKYKIPIRIGVNAGSLERSLTEKYGGATPEALAESAFRYYELLEKTGYSETVVSLKASDVSTTISANRLFAEKCSAPLHLGITEAGTPDVGVIKSAIGIGTLLAEGIGDTIRVSLTASPIEEIKVARQILQALGIRVFGPELISCPTCGRCATDLVLLAEKVEVLLKNYTVPIRVAVMGCAVNGPGEAREADIGISAGKKKGILFRNGNVIRTVSQDKLLPALKEEIDAFVKAKDESGSFKEGNY